FSGDHLLFDIMHHNFHRLQPVKIASICCEVNQNRRSSKDKPQSLREYLGSLAAAQSATLFSGDETTDRLVHLHQLLEKLVIESENQPLLKWLEILFNEAGILSYIMSQPDKSRMMQLLNGFFDYVQQECRRNPDLDLQGLVDQLDLLEENGLGVPLVQTSGNENGVNLLTCHGSKGLEFEYVFLMGCYSSVWESKRNNGRGYKIPPNVFTKETPEEKEEELRRLFFVAATRAEKHLVISYPLFSNDGTQLEATRFISEMMGAIKPDVWPVTDDLRLKYSTFRYGMVQQPELDKSERDFIEKLLAGFKMNVTALSNYLECPVKFYYTTLIRVPSAVNEAAQFGSSMHDALNFYYNLMMESDRRYPPKEVLLNRFRWHLASHREVFTKAGLDRFVEYGAQCLSAFYDTYFAETSGDFIRTEVALEATINDIPIKGFADKLQYWGHEVMITDFKTGSLKKSNLRHEFVPAGHPKKEHGGNYWRQAVFYKILFDRQRGKNKELRGIEFHYIEPNDEKQFDIKQVRVTSTDEAAVMNQITETWQKIQAHDFYTGCGKPECEWCNFVKDHRIYTSLHEVETEPVEFKIPELDV
ncbi:MAG TPA: PD-(D/E)XK nuclease family protein, partial [Flavisolibacter sp.]